MAPQKETLLGIIAPVIVAELDFSLIIETDMEFLHHARKVYDVDTEVALECLAGEGLVLFEGLVIEDVYYVGLVDNIVRGQVLKVPFNGLQKSPAVRRDMVCRGTASIRKENVLNEIIDGCKLRQKLLVDINIKVVREQTIPRSSIAGGPTEHPIYRVGTVPSLRELGAVYGPEMGTDYPDITPNDPSAVIPAENVWHKRPLSDPQDSNGGPGFQGENR